MSLDDTGIVADAAEQLPEPVPGNVQFAIESTPAELRMLDLLAGLLLGGATEGSDQIGRRLKRWQATIVSDGSQIYSESPDESQGQRLRYAAIGLLSQAPEIAQGVFSTTVGVAASAYSFCSYWLRPLTHSRPMQPVLRQYDHFAAHGAMVVDRWIDAGRTVEQHSRALVRQAAFDGEDEAIEEVVGKLAQEPALRDLLRQQSVGMAGELAGAIRTRTAQADMQWQRRVRTLFRRH